MNDKISLRRTASLIAILISLGLLTGMLALKGDFYPDEWICIIYICSIFYMVFVFELEYERLRDKISKNNRTDFSRISIGFFICSVLVGCFAFLPIYLRPIIFIPIILCFVGNEFIAFICGSFFVILLSVTISGDYYELVSELILVIFGSILAKSLKDDKLRPFVYILLICVNSAVPNLFYYIANKEYSIYYSVIGAGIGVASVLLSVICFQFINPNSKEEIPDFLIDIITDDYSEVREVKKYSKAEYEHSDLVSTISYKAAKAAGLDANLCAAAGFYYRMGQWQGEPYIENGVKKAESLCFPERLINILWEYHGEVRKPQTPESALVHMVDALVIRLKNYKSEIGNSDWNHEIIVVQILNEFSVSGIYDESGLGMNHFLKIRDYLKKEEKLR